MSPRVPAVLLALLVLAMAASAVGAIDDASAQTEGPTNGTLAPEETVIEVQLESDGDARWEITEHFVLTDESERAAFDDLGESFEARTAGSLGLDTFRRAVDEANDETTRTMRIRDADHSVERENASLSEVRGLNGTYTLSFTWTNFAREDGDSYVVEDAFNSSDGTWFGGLTTDERLIVALPPRHGASAAPKAFEENELRWEGPTTFEPGYLRIVYSGNLDPPNPGNGDPLLVWGALGVAVLALLGAGILLARRQGLDPAAIVGGAGDEDQELDAVGEDDEESPAEDDAGEGEEEALELLSDEERVERLLADNGGRMKQANIVKETGWSNAKVSQLLSAMEEDGQIRKLRIGRENLITFPDEEVGDFES